MVLGQDDKQFLVTIKTRKVNVPINDQNFYSPG